MYLLYLNIWRLLILNSQSRCKMSAGKQFQMTGRPTAHENVVKACRRGQFWHNVGVIISWLTRVDEWFQNDTTRRIDVMVMCVIADYRCGKKN